MADQENVRVMLKDLLREYVEVKTSQDREVIELCIDSRLIKAGELFFAYPGIQADGRDYIKQAIEAGASAVIAEQGRDLPEQQSGVPIFQLKDVKQLIGRIASRFYGYPSRFLDVIGFTGTNGKTTCTQYLAAALHQPEYPCGVFGTMGNGLFTQLKPSDLTTEDAVSIQRHLVDLLRQRAKAVVMEVSSHALDQGRVAGLEFDIGVFTNLTRDHLDYHKNMDEYAQAKRRLFVENDLRYAVINADDPFGLELLSDLREQLSVFGYSAIGRKVPGVPMIYAQGVKVTANGLSADIFSPWGNGNLTSHLLGRFNLSNQLAVLACLGILGISLQDALARLATVHRVPGRMEPFGGGDQPLVIVDYAHTPDALEQALQALKEVCKGKLWCVFGCGGERDRGKRAQMAKTAEQYCDQLVITDDNPRNDNPQEIVVDILSGLSLGAPAVVEHDRAAAIDYAVNAAEAGDVILVAGKGHECYQIVSGEKNKFSDREHVRAALGLAEKEI